ncbi:MAG: DUF1285 domain-containing protein [Deltaproteobacteria bacterium]|nr:DUF1285 domain-containing protein [Deltaproteobacteria bacterium]
MRDPRDDLEDVRPDAPAGLYLSRRGNWFHDGERVRHERLAALLSGSIARADDGGLVVTTGRDTVAFAAEDAPLFVLSVDVDAGGITLLLSDRSREALADVVVGPDDRLRAPVRERRFWALFSRSAGQLLEPFVVDEGLVVGSRTWPIRACSVDWSRPP